MSPYLRRMFLVTIIFSIPQPSLYAQDDAFSAEQSVDRVIKLRSSAAPIPPSLKEVKKPIRSSRNDRLARRPAELPDPNQIEFDEISAEPSAGTPLSQTNQQPIPQLRTPLKQRSVVVRDLVSGQSTQFFGNPGTMEHQRDVNTSSSVVTTVAPQISTRILAPKFVNLGQPTSIRIQLQNVSQQTAQEVKVFATLPSHAKFTSARPAPTKVEGQQYEFKVGRIGTRQVREIQIEMVPNEKLPIKVATQIQVLDQQSIAVSVREPKLRIDIAGPQQVHTGQWVSHVLTVTNVGDGIAENVRFAREQITALHVEKNQLEYIIRRIAPGETKRAELKSFTQSAGKFDLGFAVTSNNLNPQKLTRVLTVLQPELEVSAVGPNVNFVNRDGIYKIQIDNTGLVDVTDVSIGLDVAEGFEVTTVSRQAKVEPQTGRLNWFFKKIDANSKEEIQLKAVSKTPGRQVCTIEVRSNETQAEQIKLVTRVAARADVSINLSNQGGPVEVGGKTEFVVAVSNKGSSLASDVQVKVEFSASLMPISQPSYSVRELDNTIQFTPLEIAPGETKEFRFGVVGVSAGEHVVRSVVKLNGSERSLMAEGSVFVFETDQSKVSESLEPTIHRK